MTDKRDICERIEERLDISKFHDAGLLDGWALPGVKDLLLEAKAEIERIRAIAAEAHAKPYHYMTADGKTIPARELESQRNAAWRALFVRIAMCQCPECGTWLDDSIDGNRHSKSCPHFSADEEAIAFVTAEQANKEGK